MSAPISSDPAPSGKPEHQPPPMADQTSPAARRLAGWLIGVLALVAVVWSLVVLEGERSGLAISDIEIGTTPATLYSKGDAAGPVVVIAHGFAGSRQLMQAYSLTLAQSGYRVLAFDFEGHGRNPVPMSGDVTSVDGTTALLVAETRRVIAKARTLAPSPDQVAVLGHSMATDIIVRAANAEQAEGRPVAAVVAISMFSGAVTATEPPRLLIITGQWESALRRAALATLRQVDPAAGEGTTVSVNGVSRRAIVAPDVEHVGVLFSATALSEARGWLDASFNHKSDGPVIPHGLWIILLLGGIVTLMRPLTRLLPLSQEPVVPVSATRFWLALLLPACLVPLAGTAAYVPFMPVLVADYLMLHLALYGLIQIAILWPAIRFSISPVAIAVLVFWGIAVFGLAMDRHVASFVPNAERIAIIAVLAIGTVPFMVADAALTGAGSGPWWRRIAARVGIIFSLAFAVLLDPARLMFLFIILPVLVLFYLLYGLLGRWIGQRAGAVSAGIGLGLCLAWSLGVSFPLFVAS